MLLHVCGVDRSLLAVGNNRRESNVSDEKPHSGVATHTHTHTGRGEWRASGTHEGGREGLLRSQRPGEGTLRENIRSQEVAEQPSCCQVQLARSEEALPHALYTHPFVVRSDSGRHTTTGMAVHTWRLVWL